MAHLSPLGFAACQSKKCTDISGGALVSSAPTKKYSFAACQSKKYTNQEKKLIPVHP